MPHSPRGDVFGRCLIPALHSSTISAIARADIRASLGGIDPTQIGVAIELGERIEERGCLWLGCKRRNNISGEILTLRTFGKQHHIDLVTGRDPTATPPRWTEQDAAPLAERFDDCAHAHPVHRSGHTMVLLRTPRFVWVERNRHEYAPVARRAEPRSSSSSSDPSSRGSCSAISDTAAERHLTTRLFWGTPSRGEPRGQGGHVQLGVGGRLRRGRE